MKGTIAIAALMAMMLSGCGGVVGDVKDANIPVIGIGQYKIGDVLDSRSGCDSVSWEKREHKGAEIVEYICEYTDEEAEQRVNEEWSKVLAAIERFKKKIVSNTSPTNEFEAHLRSDKYYENLAISSQGEFIIKTRASSTRGVIVAQFAIDENGVQLMYAGSKGYVGEVKEVNFTWKMADSFYHSMVEDAPLTHIIEPLTEAQAEEIVKRAMRRQ